MGATPEAKVQIMEETPGDETGGHFSSETIVFNADENQVTAFDFVPKLPIALLAAHLDCKKTNDGDELRFEVGPSTIVGVLDQTVAASGTAIPLSTAVSGLFVSGAIWPGMELELNDGTNVDNVGLITAFDEVAGNITVDIPTSFEFAPGTYLQVTTSMSSPIIGDGWMEISQGPSKVLSVGLSKIGATRIEAGTTVRVLYKNNHATDSARPRIHLEYLY